VLIVVLNVVVVLNAVVVVKAVDVVNVVVVEREVPKEVLNEDTNAVLVTKLVL
jgi:hypothetical protein